jgi:hypothetical protein
MSVANFSSPACECITEDAINTSIGEWALIHKGELAGLYPSPIQAWNDAAARFRNRRCQVRPISSSVLKMTISSLDLVNPESRLISVIQKAVRAITRYLFPASELSY